MEEQMVITDSESIESQKMEDTFTLQPVTEEEALLGRNATRHFMNEEYHDCLCILQDLAQRRPFDPRVLTNLAVCQYFASDDCSKTDRLIQSLLKTYRQLIDSYGGEFDSDQGQEYCVLIYNLALTRIDVKSYATAEEFLSLLYSTTSPMLAPNPKDKSQLNNDINFAMDQILPLLISLNLFLKNPSKALNLISRAEQKIKQESDSATQQRIFLSHALALVQSKAFKSFKRDLKPNGSLSMTNQVTYEFLRANLGYCRGNSRKAMKLLGLGIQQVISAQMDESWMHYINSLYQNNLGCLHLIMKKPNLGVFYTSQASDSHTLALAKMDKTSPHFLLKIKRNEILYNTAMNLLHAGQPATAFTSFLTLSQSFSSLPSYWLRLAECCINHTRHDEEYISKMYSNPTWLGTKKIIVQPESYTSTLTLEKSLARLLGVNSVVAELSLKFALFCLMCAEKLWSRNDFMSRCDNQIDKTSSSNPSSGSSSPSKAVTLHSRNRLVLLSIWSNLSYIYLHQRDYVKALEWSEKILSSNQAPVPSGYKYLAHLYASEAKMKLNRSDEAMPLLDYSTHFVDLTFGDSTSNSNEFSDSSLNDRQLLAKTMFHINLAVAYIDKEEIGKAEDILERLASSNCPSELNKKIMSLRLYLSLSKGNVEKARELATKFFEDKSFEK